MRYNREQKIHQTILVVFLGLVMLLGASYACWKIGEYLSLPESIGISRASMVRVIVGSGFSLMFGLMIAQTKDFRSVSSQSIFYLLFLGLGAGEALAVIYLAVRGITVQPLWLVSVCLVACAIPPLLGSFNRIWSAIQLHSVESASEQIA